MSFAVGRVPESSSFQASRLSEPMMLIPPRRSTPSFGAHLAQIIKLATNKEIVTIVIRPLYSDSFKPLLMNFAKNQPATTVAISSKKTHWPDWKNEGSTFSGCPRR